MRKAFVLTLFLFCTQALAQGTSALVGTEFVEDGTTRLVIHPTTLTYNIEGQNYFQGFDSEIIRTDGAYAPLRTFVLGNGFGNLGSELEINIVNQMGQYSRLDLPRATEQRLLRFLEVGSPANLVCDCHCLAAYVAGYNHPHTYNGGQFQPMNALDPSAFREIHSEASMNPGDAILLTAPVEGGQLTVHSMIYLGEGLYLSKLGPTGSLVVTNLQEIQRAYPSDRMFLYPEQNQGASPVSEPSDSPAFESITL